MKNKLRNFAKTKRKKIDTEKISVFIAQNIRKSEIFKKSKNILIFYPKQYELNLLSLTENRGKNWFLPRCRGNELEVCPYSPGDELKMSCFKVLEPICESVHAQIADLVITPALGADLKKHRLGYGKGYYDRFFEKSKAVKILAVPNCLIFESVFPEEYDIACDFVVSEKGMF